MAAIDAQRARSLIGVPFRPQGRDPQQGLDCVGLCLAAYRLPARQVRGDYRLRGNHRGELEDALSKLFRKINAADMLPGDLLLLSIASDQSHLAVLTSAGFVHADARLRRVVETPGEPLWPLAGIYRIRRRKKS